MPLNGSRLGLPVRILKKPQSSALTGSKSNSSKKPKKMNIQKNSNVLAQQRSAQISVETKTGDKEFGFTFSRNQVAQMVLELGDEKRRFESSRHWLLAGVSPEQRSQLIELFDDPENFTLEVSMMGALAPFLANNQAVIKAVNVR